MDQIFNGKNSGNFFIFRYGQMADIVFLHQGTCLGS